MFFFLVPKDSPKDELSLVTAVKNVHKIIDKEIAAGTNPSNVFVCGFSQGGPFLLSISTHCYLAVFLLKFRVRIQGP